MTIKANYTTSDFKLWKEKVLVKVKEKITKLKQKTKPKQTKPVLSDPYVKSHLKSFIEKLLLSPFIKHRGFCNGKRTVSLHLYLSFRSHKTT